MYSFLKCRNVKEGGSYAEERDCFKGSSIKVKWKWKTRQLGVKERVREIENSTLHALHKKANVNKSK